MPSTSGRQESYPLTIGGKIFRDLPIVAFPSGNPVAAFVCGGTWNSDDVYASDLLEDSHLEIPG